MKIKLALILTLLTSVIYADTNVLELTWLQPPGYQSELFTSTNLVGVWQPLSTNAPPFQTYSDKDVAFFYVVVKPTPIQMNYVGGFDPSAITALAGATFVGTNDPTSFWFKVSNVSSNGWTQGI
jgi:hypothetical protein